MTIWYKKQNKIPRIWKIFSDKANGKTKSLAVKTYRDFVGESVLHFIKSYEDIHQQPFMRIVEAFNVLSVDLKDNGKRESQAFELQSLVQTIGEQVDHLEENLVPFVKEVLFYLSEAAKISDEYDYYYTIWYAHNILKMAKHEYRRFVQDMPDPSEFESKEDSNIQKIGNTGIAPLLNDEIDMEEFSQEFEGGIETKAMYPKHEMVVTKRHLHQAIAKLEEIYKSNEGVAVSTTLAETAFGIPKDVLRQLAKGGYLVFNKDESAFTPPLQNWQLLTKVIDGEA